MNDADPFHLELGSNEYFEICETLNSLAAAPDAKAAFDGMSGGFRFADEVPQSRLVQTGPLSLPMVSLLRYLWGFRLSLVIGQPRRELEPWWTATQDAAPNWPGFLPTRRSREMSALAQQCADSSRKLHNDLDRLDALCQKRHESHEATTQSR